MYRHSKSKSEISKLNFQVYKRRPKAMKILKRNIREKMMSKYITDKNSHNKKIVTDLVFNEKSHLVASFKDYLIFDDLSEFLRRLYKTEEIKLRLPKIIEYYENYSKIFPNYTKLDEAKYIYKNIQKKQRMINKIQKYDKEHKEPNEPINKKTLNENFDDENNSYIFDTKIYEYIMNLTETQGNCQEVSLLKLVYNADAKQHVHVFKQENTCDSIERLIGNIGDAEDTELITEFGLINTEIDNLKNNLVVEENIARSVTNLKCNDASNFEINLLEKKLKEIKHKKLDSADNTTANKAKTENGSTICTANQGASSVNSRPLSSNKSKQLIHNICDDGEIPQNARIKVSPSISDNNKKLFSVLNQNLLKNNKISLFDNLHQGSKTNMNTISLPAFKPTIIQEKFINKFTISTQKDFHSAAKNMNANANTTSRAIPAARYTGNFQSNNTLRESTPNTMTRTSSIFKSKLATIQNDTKTNFYDKFNKEKRFHINLNSITNRNTFNTLNSDRKVSSTSQKIRKLSTEQQSNNNNNYLSPRKFANKIATTNHRKINSLNVLDLKSISKPTIIKQKHEALTSRLTPAKPGATITTHLQTRPTKIIPPIYNFKELIKQSTILPMPNSDRTHRVKVDRLNKIK